MSKAIICNKYHYCIHLCQGYGQLEEQIDKFVQMKLSLDFYDLNCEGQNIAVSVCNICVFKMCPPVERVAAWLSSNWFCLTCLVGSDCKCGYWLVHE